MIFMGGDVAYDNGMKSCYHTWDYILYALEKHYKLLGYYTPFVVTIGNHDIGLDAYIRENNPENVKLKQ